MHKKHTHSTLDMNAADVSKKGSDTNLAQSILGQHACWFPTMPVAMRLHGVKKIRAGDLSDTQRLLESVYIQHKENEQCFWIGVPQEAFQSDKAVPAFGIDCGGSDALG